MEESFRARLELLNSNSLFKNSFSAPAIHWGGELAKNFADYLSTAGREVEQLWHEFVCDYSPKHQIFGLCNFRKQGSHQWRIQESAIRWTGQPKLCSWKKLRCKPKEMESFGHQVKLMPDTSFGTGRQRRVHAFTRCGSKEFARDTLCKKAAGIRHSKTLTASWHSWAWEANAPEIVGRSFCRVHNLNKSTAEKTWKHRKFRNTESIGFLREKIYKF